MAKKDKPTIKWQRTYKVNIKVLLKAVKSVKDLRMLCLYLNLYSLYREKSIHNYKANLQNLSFKTGFTDSQLRQTIKLLLDNNFCYVEKGNLNLYSHTRFSNYFKLEEDLYDGFEIHHTKNLDFVHYGALSVYDLQQLCLQLKSQQKKYIYAKSLMKNGSFRKTKMSNRYLAIAKIQENLANDPLVSKKFNLFLNDVKNLFGLKSNQAASYRLKQLEEKGLIKISHQFRYIKKVISPDKRVNSKTFVKNGWLIEQMPNHIEFVKEIYDKEWWSEVITKHHKVFMKSKAAKIKHKIDYPVLVVVNRAYNKRPVTISKRSYKKVFIDRSTGEIVHEHFFDTFRNLFINGNSFYTKHLTEFKKLNLESYFTQIINLGQDIGGRQS